MWSRSSERLTAWCPVAPTLWSRPSPGTEPLDVIRRVTTNEHHVHRAARMRHQPEGGSIHELLRSEGEEVPGAWRGTHAEGPEVDAEAVGPTGSARSAPASTRLG